MTKTFFYRHTSGYVAGFTIALLFLQLAEVTLYTKRLQAVGGLAFAQETFSGVTECMEKFTKYKYVLACRKSGD